MKPFPKIEGTKTNLENSCELIKKEYIYDKDEEIPENFSWNGKGVLAPVRDQEGDSCFACAAVNTVKYLYLQILAYVRWSY